MTNLTRYNCEGHDAKMVEDEAGDWIWAEKALAAMAELEADKARLVGENLRLRRKIKQLKQEAVDYW